MLQVNGKLIWVVFCYQEAATFIQNRLKKIFWCRRPRQVFRGSPLSGYSYGVYSLQSPTRRTRNGRRLRWAGGCVMKQVLNYEATDSGYRPKAQYDSPAMPCKKQCGRNGAAVVLNYEAAQKFRSGLVSSTYYIQFITWPSSTPTSAGCPHQKKSNELYRVGMCPKLSFSGQIWQLAEENLLRKKRNFTLGWLWHFSSSDCISHVHPQQGTTVIP